MTEKQTPHTGFEMKITDQGDSFQDPDTGLTPLPEEPITPLEIPTYDEAYPEAAQIFAEQVAKVRATGDVFDDRKSLRTKRIVAQLAAPFVVASELAATSGVPTLTAAVTGMAGTGLVVWRARRQDRKVFRQEHDRLTEGDQKVGQQYELYRKASIHDKHSNDIALFWYEPSTEAGENYGTLENLRQMALLAKDNGVTDMHVTCKQYDQICSYTQGQCSYDDRFAWELLRYKGVGIKKEANMDLFMPGTPQDWLDFVDQWQPHSFEAADGKLTLHEVLEKLAALRPDNALLDITERYPKNKIVDEDMQREYQGCIDRTISMRLFRQEQYPERGKEFKRDGRPFLPADITDTEAGYVSADAEYIVWRTKRNGLKFQEICSAFGMSREEYDLYLSKNLDESAELDVEKLVSAFEIAIIRDAHQQSIAFEDQNKRDIQLPIRPVVTQKLQAQFADGLNKTARLLPHRLRQTGAAIATVCGIGAVLYGAHAVADGKEASAIEYSRVRLANERKVDLTFVENQDAKDYLDQRSGWWNAWHAYSDVENTVNPSWKTLKDMLPDFDDDKEPAKPAQSSATTFGVGNTNLPDTPEFRITPHGGADPVGFWEATTSQTLKVMERSEATGRGFTLEWQQENLSAKDMIAQEVPVTLPNAYKKGPSLEVHRTLDAVDFFGVEQNQSSPELNQNIHQIANIPVREGMKLMAASVDGEKVRLVEKHDGTYGITAQNGKAITGDLTYWLTPDQGRKVKSPFTYLSLLTLSPDTNDYSPTDSKQLLHTPVLGTAGRRHYELVEQEDKNTTRNKVHQSIMPSKARDLEETIRDDWKYSFTPFKRDAEDNWKSLDDFEAAAKQVKQANCNIANTLVGLQDVTSAQVIGYQNGLGSGATTLSAKEAHQKRTDGDATPTVKARELPPQQPIELPVSPGALGFALGGLAVLSQQRRIRRAVRKAAVRSDAKAQAAYEDARDVEHYTREAVLADQPAEYIAQAQATVQRMLYASSVDAESIKRDATRMAQQSSSSPHQALLDSAVYTSDEAIALLEEYRVNAVSGFADDIARSVAILRQARQVHRDRDSQPEVVRSAIGRIIARSDIAAASLRSRLTKIRAHEA